VGDLFQGNFTGHQNAYKSLLLSILIINTLISAGYVTNFIHLKASAMNKSFNLLFYVKRSKTNAEGLAPVYLRITVDGVRIEVSSKRYVNPDKWNTNEQKLTGNSEDVKTINAYLKTLEHQVYDVHRDMIERKFNSPREIFRRGIILARREATA